MKVLIVGASGFIGGQLYCALKQQDGMDVAGTCFLHRDNTDFLFLDATDKPSVRKVLNSLDPSMIVLAAGNKNVKECEQDYERAYQQNVLPLKNLVEIVLEDRKKTKIIFFSSDYVFDGVKGMYTDTDTACPMTNYGKTKLISEELLLSSGLDGKVVRTTAVIGPGSVFWKWLCQMLRAGGECKMFSRVYFSPTSMELLADVMIFLINNYTYIGEQIIHVTNGQRMSRFEFALMCQKQMKASRSNIICDEGSDGFPMDLSLRPSRIQQQVQVGSLEEYVRGIING